MRQQVSGRARLSMLSKVAGSNGGLVICNPIPEPFALAHDAVDLALEQALAEASRLALRHFSANASKMACQIALRSSHSSVTTSAGSAMQRSAFSDQAWRMRSLETTSPWYAFMVVE